MTANDFQALALKNPGAFESEHVGHPDFRFNGKVFATLGYPAGGWAMVKLTPDQQRHFLGLAPGIFQAASGAWGKSGSTTIQLELAKKTVVKAALTAAFTNIAALKKESLMARKAARRRS
jgi:hypothetical protein